MFEYDFTDDYKSGVQTCLYWRDKAYTNKQNPVLIKKKNKAGEVVETSINYPTQAQFAAMYEDDSLKKYIIRTEIQEPIESED